ncbi:Bax inhibitor-1/YccA family protein [Pelagibius marinus]|uniref:Bax inhibitor-1/YccA family protein n=1 Tax=Pelagibius marinus TaxID=2762760 RepID=UPI0018727614|nr:Bax inhibitor-1/YccA family protein [Pelagibius marinus]
MALGDRRYMSQSQTQARAGEYDEGLRKYMLGVYNYMTVAMVITGVLAYLTSTSAALQQMIFGTPLAWVVMLAPLGFVFFLSARVHKMSASAAQITFWLFAAAMGLSLSSIFLSYSLPSITKIFFITAGAFAGLSLVGYTTKKDLSGMGSFLMMGLIGIIIAMVVNFFLQSPAMQWVISVVGVLIFAGLTAYDTQQIKNMYYAADSGEVATKKSIMGALRLYLDFLNLFLFLLQLFGNRN